jgi:TetR/AcrR family acrAB operon transcriptional repressor
MARRTKEEAAETRQQILETALDVFSKKGFSRTTFVDIAGQIGLSKGAVYWHFKTKTDLLVALIDYSCSRKCGRVENPDELPETLAALRSCYVETARIVLSDPSMRKFEFFIHFQIEWSEELMAEVRSKLNELREDPIRKYTTAIQRLQEIGEVSGDAHAERMGSLLMATWFGLIRMALLGLFPEHDVPEQLEYSFDLMFKDIVRKEQEL